MKMKKSAGLLCFVVSFTAALSACSSGHAGSVIPAASLPDAREVLPPPPVPGSAGQADDDQVFKATRDLRGSSRWMLAQHDALLDKATLLEDFSCAVGYKLDLKQAPHLKSFFDKVAPAIKERTSQVKHLWHRRRPFVGTDQPTCTTVADLGLYSSFPSGHTTAGYGMALVLASLLPEKAGPVLQRGRIFGESRIVCGVHWKSDVEAGYLNAASQMSVLLREPSLQEDLKAAQDELRAMAHTQPPVDAAQCQAERDAADHSLLSAP